eukprot:snap_masked-scaffold_51-processed-gene-1.35-mRNA-1 protein AED:1.00 eAED:1.00 QI:0/0/0/0/1/1/2/0/64
MVNLIFAILLICWNNCQNNGISGKLEGLIWKQNWNIENHVLFSLGQWNMQYKCYPLGRHATGAP